MKNILKTLPVTIKNGRIALNFKLADVKAMTIVGVDLVALMQDGSRLLLPGLALKVLEKPSPQLQFEDQDLAGTELFTKVDIDNVTLKDASEALGFPVPIRRRRTPEAPRTRRSRLLWATAGRNRRPARRTRALRNRPPGIRNTAGSSAWSAWRGWRWGCPAARRAARTNKVRPTSHPPIPCLMPPVERLRMTPRPRRGRPRFRSPGASRPVCSTMLRRCRSCSMTARAGSWGRAN